MMRKKVRYISLLLERNSVSQSRDTNTGASESMPQAQYGSRVTHASEWAKGSIPVLGNHLVREVTGGKRADALLMWGEELLLLGALVKRRIELLVRCGNLNTEGSAEGEG